MSERVLMSPDDVRRAITRIAHEGVEQHHGCEDHMLVGMRTRGRTLAEPLAATSRDCGGEAVPVRPRRDVGV